MAGRKPVKKSLFSSTGGTWPNKRKRGRSASITKKREDRLDLRCSDLEKELPPRGGVALLRGGGQADAGRLAELEAKAAAAESRVARLEASCGPERENSEYKEKASTTTRRRPHTGLELDASRRAAKSKGPRRGARRDSRNCSAYIASGKPSITRSATTRAKAPRNNSGDESAADRLSVLSALLGDRAEAFDFESIDKDGAYGAEARRRPGAGGSGRAAQWGGSGGI
jgi:hypothetical protein